MCVCVCVCVCVLQMLGMGEIAQMFAYSWWGLMMGICIYLLQLMVMGKHGVDDGLK